MLKKLATSVALALSLTSLAACSDESSGGSDGDLTIAVVVPLTGASAKTAQQMQNSAELAADEINADGGVGGRQIKLKIYDDKLTPEDATKEAQRAVTRDDAIGIVGAQSSGEALAIREV